jgi:hypothetical protein
MGPDGLNLTTPLRKGGQFKEEYPVDKTDYMEGILEKHWNNHESRQFNFTKFSEVSLFVSRFMFIF